MNASNMPDGQRKILNSVFRRMRQRIVWKWESDTMEDKPDNVLLQKWCPQQDILGHPNVKAFITHGGLLSLEEGIFHNTPMLFLPGFGDQINNAVKATDLGIGERLHWSTLNEDDLWYGSHKCNLKLYIKLG